MPEKLPSGLWPVMLTPFSYNYTIDENALKELVDFQIEAGANGLFANCLSSEMFQLTIDERLEIIKIILSKSSVPVVATSVFNFANFEESIDIIKATADLGVAAVIILTNQLADYDEGDDIFKSRVEKILQHTSGIPLGLYECPEPYKRLLSPAMISWIANNDRFVYYKDTSCHLDDLNNKINAAHDSNLSIYNANTPTALSSLKLGANGICPISANFYPELYAYLVNQFEEKDKENEMNFLSSFLSVMDSVTGNFYPYSAKVFLQMRGLNITNICRKPTGIMKYEDKAKLRSLMDVLQYAATSLNINLAIKKQVLNNF